MISIACAGNCWAAAAELTLICKAEQSLDSAEFPSINSFHAVTYTTARCAKLRKVRWQRLTEVKALSNETMKYLSTLLRLYDQLLLSVCAAGLRDSVFCGGGSWEKESCHQYQRDPVAKGDFFLFCFCFHGFLSRHRQHLQSRWCDCPRLLVNMCKRMLSKLLQGPNVAKRRCNQSKLLARTTEMRKQPFKGGCSSLVRYYYSLIWSQEKLWEGKKKKKSCMMITASGWGVSHFNGDC